MNPILGIVPVLSFPDLERLKSFIDGCTKFYEEHNPTVPSVFIEAFSEGEERGNIRKEENDANRKADNC